MRRADLAKRLGLEELDGLLVVAESSRDPDLAPFVGDAHLGDSFLVLPVSGAPRLGYFTPMERGEAAATGLETLSPETLGIEELRRENGSDGALWGSVLVRALERAGVGPGRFAVAGRLAAGVWLDASRSLEREGYRLCDGRELSLGLRRPKSGFELDSARRAAAGTCAAFRRAAELLARCRISGDGSLVLEGEPLTGGRVRRSISLALAEFGLDQPQGNIVSAAGDAGVPHAQGDSERALRAGEALIIDLFPKGHLFCDCTRTFCVGEAPAELAAAHAAVLAALVGALAAAAPGVLGWDLQQAACRHFTGAGHPTPVSDPGTTEGYVHGLGHGVGFEIHEYPSFRSTAGDAGRLQREDLFTLEPGLYYPEHPAGGFGVRLEDLVWMGGEGPENLTPLPYDLDPRAWTD